MFDVRDTAGEVDFGDYMTPCSKTMRYHHRKRIKTDEKPKVVAAVWGTELIQFLAALNIFHMEDFKEKDE